MKTSSLRDVGHRVWDIIVLGAGPAGSTAARILASSGRSVLLLDKKRFPRTKVCGCCLNGSAIRLLRESGMADVLGTAGVQSLTELRLHVGAYSGNLPLSNTLVMSREALDTSMVDRAIDAGACFVPEVTVRSTHLEKESRCVEVQSNEDRPTLRGQLVLAATGLNSAFLESEPGLRVAVNSHSRIGVGAACSVSSLPYESRTVYMAMSKHGYVGIVRLEDGRLNVAAAFDPVYIGKAGGVGNAVANVLSQARLPVIPRSDLLHWRGTSFLSQKRASVAAPRLLVLGDAAGYVEPFTGEGIAWAIASGFLAARMTTEAESQPHGVLEKLWMEVHLKHIQKKQRACAVIAALIRSETLSRALLSLLSSTPWLARPLLEYFNSSSIANGIMTAGKRSK